MGCGEQGSEGLETTLVGLERWGGVGGDFERMGGIGGLDRLRDGDDVSRFLDGS